MKELKKDLEVDRLGSEHDVARYDFAQKQATGNLKSTDLVNYLLTFAKWKIALCESRDKDATEWKTLAQTCANFDGDMVDNSVLSVVSNRLAWARKIYEIAQNSSAKLSQRQFFGMTPNSPMDRVGVDDQLSDLNELPWLPFEISGLEYARDNFISYK